MVASSSSSDCAVMPSKKKKRGEKDGELEEEALAEWLSRGLAMKDFTMEKMLSASAFAARTLCCICVCVVCSLCALVRCRAVDGRGRR